MHTSLDHIPEGKQQQILAVAEVIKEVAQPHKIILFGSYATGNWVEDEYMENGIRYTYNSDYDFLVVTKDRKEKDYILSDKIVNKSKHITQVTVNSLILELDYVNEGLRIGQYFFTDIVREGILLHDSGETVFEEAKELSREEQKEISEGYYKEWFGTANVFLNVAQDLLSKSEFKIGVFQLHQPAERFYHTMLLVFTGYKPKTHALEKLRAFTKPYSKDLFLLFPVEDSTEEAHLFDLLKRGYIDARYKHDYAITERELTTLIEKVKHMATTVETTCSRHLVSL